VESLGVKGESLLVIEGLVRCLIPAGVEGIRKKNTKERKKNGQGT